MCALCVVRVSSELQALTLHKMYPFSTSLWLIFISINFGFAIELEPLPYKFLYGGDDVWTNLWSKLPSFRGNNTESAAVSNSVPEPTTVKPIQTTEKQQIIYIPLSPSHVVYVPSSDYTSSYVRPPYPISYHNAEPYQYQYQYPYPYQYQDPSVFQPYSYGSNDQPPAVAAAVAAAAAAAPYIQYESKVMDTSSLLAGGDDQQIEYLQPQNDNAPASAIIQPDQLKGFYAHIKKLAQLGGIQLEEEQHGYKDLKPEQPQPNVVDGGGGGGGGGGDYKDLKPIHEAAKPQLTEAKPTVGEPTTLYMARNVTEESRHLDEEDQLDIRAPVPTYADVVNWVQNFTNEWVNMQVNQRNESVATTRPEKKPAAVYMFRDKNGNLCTKELVAQADKMYNVVMCEEKGYGDEDSEAKRTTLYKSDVTYFTDEMERSEEPMEMVERSSSLTTEPSLLD